jgi:phosphatidylethanolamine-binding protein (PEBP) family uncharacterized protein
MSLFRLSITRKAAMKTTLLSRDMHVSNGISCMYTFDRSINEQGRRRRKKKRMNCSFAVKKTITGRFSSRSLLLGLDVDPFTSSLLTFIHVYTAIVRLN